MADVTQRFTLLCRGWQDDGFDIHLNVSDLLLPEQTEENTLQDSAGRRVLYYKFMIRKNGITVPVAEGGTVVICMLCFLGGACCCRC